MAVIFILYCREMSCYDENRLNVNVLSCNISFLIVR